jgi:hypothetical protein
MAQKSGNSVSSSGKADAVRYRLLGLATRVLNARVGSSNGDDITEQRACLAQNRARQLLASRAYELA